MDLTELGNKLSRGSVYLYDDYEDAVLRITPQGNSCRGYIKRRGRGEYEVDLSNKDYFEMQMNGGEISKDEYEKFH